MGVLRVAAAMVHAEEFVVFFSPQDIYKGGGVRLGNILTFCHKILFHLTWCL